MNVDINGTIEKGMRVLWLIWSAMVVSLGVYLAICHLLGDEIRGQLNITFPLDTFKKTLLLVAFGIAVIIYFFRKKMLSAPASGSGTNLQFFKNPSGQAPYFAKYTVIMIISLALSESIGIFGLVLFFLGGTYQTLHTFIGISAICMFYCRPKQEEVEKLAGPVGSKNG